MANLVLSFMQWKSQTGFPEIAPQTGHSEMAIRTATQTGLPMNSPLDLNEFFVELLSFLLELLSFFPFSFEGMFKNFKNSIQWKFGLVASDLV